jgi:hypothetical protein
VTNFSTLPSFVDVTLDPTDLLAATLEVEEPLALVLALPALADADELPFEVAAGTVPLLVAALEPLVDPAELPVLVDDGVPL